MKTEMPSNRLSELKPDIYSSFSDIFIIQAYKEAADSEEPIDNALKSEIDKRMQTWKGNMKNIISITANKIFKEIGQYKRPDKK